MGRKKQGACLEVEDTTQPEGLEVAFQRGGGAAPKAWGNRNAVPLACLRFFNSFFLFFTCARER